MDDVKLKDVIRSGTDGDVVLLGFPYDEGVKINGGREGARDGPEKFRFWLSRFGTVNNPEWDIDLSRIKIADAGDVPKGLSLQQAHARLEEHTASALKAGAIPFVVGGGNDQSYPNASALLAQASGETGVVNIDAHLDVRPLKQGSAHSGSPFRLLLEDSRFSGKNFLAFAAQGSQSSREHADYIQCKDGSILWLSESGSGVGETFKQSLEQLASRCASLFVSFDLDSIAACHAPGVSCPGVLGLSAQDAVTIAWYAGMNPAVALFDLSEYNPQIEEERTGRLAVAIFYYFCLGVASRKVMK